MKNVNRTKHSIVYKNIELDLNIARELFKQGRYLDSLDLYEQLASRYQAQSIEILAEVHDIYQLLPSKENRYHLYQSRYFDFDIHPTDKVLDIGSGHLPFPFATHLADLDLNDGKLGRAGIPFKHIDGKPVFMCNIQEMPFDDKEFDFVYCSHVLEHVSDPERACLELMRVAKRGYIESPTRGKDILFNNAKKSNHRWAINSFNNILVFNEYTPEEIEGIQCDVLADMHISPQSNREKAVSALIYLKANLLNTMFYWEDKFDYEIRQHNSVFISSELHVSKNNYPIEINPNDSKTQLQKVTVNQHSKIPLLSFVTIVLNGMPFIEPCLKAIYNSAHEIIIIEESVTNCLFAANPDGSSIDGTVEFIKSFPDPENKIRLIQGIWPEKCEMQNKALEYVTGDYVWLVDSDEIYKQDDIERIRQILAADPSISQINFIPDNFWKGFDHIFVSPQFFAPPHHYRRLFKFVPGAYFKTHRPPTLVWPEANKSTEQMKLIDGTTTREMGIYPYHYSYVFESQVEQKIELYRRYGWGDGWGVDLERWYREFFQRWTPENGQDLERLYPIWTGDPDSYSVPFTGHHPEVVENFLFRNPLLAPVNRHSNLPMRHVIEAIRETLYTFIIEPRIQALETGTIRSYHEQHESTRHISEALGNRGRLVSVDMSPDSIRISKDICRNARNVEWILSDSLSYLKQGAGKQFHFVLLDSANLADVIFDEFTLVAPMMVENGILMVDDAGISLDKRGFDGTGAQKGHKVWQFLRDCGATYDILETPAGHGTQIKVIFTQDNRRRILDALSNTTAASSVPGIRIAGEGVQGKDLTEIQQGSEFETRLRELVLSVRPRSVIETGTYLGKGTTRIIATALRDAGLGGTAFFSIECNPAHHQQAQFNLGQAGLLPYVRPLLGLSVPRIRLPSLEQIHEETVRNLEGDGIFVDHKEHERVALYHRETDFPGIPEDLLGACLRETGYRPDIVLLDSGGHMGNVEFNYLTEQLQGECYVVLDDIKHIKHHRSFKQMQADPRFTIVTASDEKFGFCIAKFTPGKGLDTGVRRILWVRPDSIGDNILAMSMLPHIQKKYPYAEITVFCQEHIAELYEASPLVKQVIPFNRVRALQDEGYRTAILRQVQGFQADLCLNSVYSREPLTDYFAAVSGARERIALNGDLSNISAEDREKNNGYYTAVLPSEGEFKSELNRHRDFLRGIGIEVERLDIPFWVGPEDIAWADRIFAEHGIDPQQTIALFAGAQYDVRLYSHYGTALANVCSEMGFSVIALGAAEDFRINQENLDVIGVKSVNLSGSATLRQSAALLSRCRLAVGAETGLAHMACAVEVPQVILLGGGHFGRFMPYSPLTSVACLPLECYGCNWRCRYERIHCVQGVKPAVITEAIRQTLTGSGDVPRIFVQGASRWRPNEGEPKRSKVADWLESTSAKVITVP